MREKMIKNTIPVTSLLVLVILGFAGAIAVGDDGLVVKSTWKSLGGNFKRTGLSENSGPELGCVKWLFETDGPVSASITIGVGGRVHIPCEDGKLYTLDHDGSLLWSYDVNSPLMSSPTIGTDGTVYVGSKNGKLYAVDVSGNLLWTHTTDGPISSSPAVSEDGNVYVGSQDGKLYALSRDGSELWSFQTKGPVNVPSGSIFASPSIGTDGTVYIAGLYDPNLYALNPNDGSLKWTCHFESQGWPFASPVIAPDGTIYQSLLYDSNLYAIEPNTGTIMWESRGATDGWSEPALGPDSTIYVSVGPFLQALDPNGGIKWANSLRLASGFTLAVGNNGLIYAASNDGYLYVFNPDGKEIARFQSNGWPNLPVIAADNMVIVSDAEDYSVLITDAINTVWAITRHGYEDLNADEDVGWLKPPPCMASNPNPADGATDVTTTPILSWTACPDAFGHDVYFGYDWRSVANADTTWWSIYQGRQFRWDTDSYIPTEAPLEWGMTYYWRIDEVSDTGTITIGTVWRFTTKTSTTPPRR
jgi:outer membrane protein assembly factor BamB